MLAPVLARGPHHLRRLQYVPFVARAAATKTTNAEATAVVDARDPGLSASSMWTGVKRLSLSTAVWGVGGPLCAVAATKVS